MSYRILMVDDDREMVTLGKLILEREGFEVIYAYSGAEGLEKLNQSDSNIDLVLLDIMMIGMDGWQVLEQLKHHLPLMKFSHCVREMFLLNLY